MNTFAKRLLRLVLLLLALTAMLSTLASCSRRAPSTGEIYDRVVELIEKAHALNTVFYGAGLPVHATDSEYAELMQIYRDDPQKGIYEAVSERSMFHSEMQIRAAAEEVYSKAYLEQVIYPAIFTGYAISDTSGKPHFANGRYLEDRGWIYQYTGEKVTASVRLIYCFAEMQVVKPSSDKLCFVEIPCYPAGRPEEVRVRRLTLVLQDGEWYLDSFSG